MTESSLRAIERALQQNHAEWGDPEDDRQLHPEDWHRLNDRRTELLAQAVAVPISTCADAALKLRIALRTSAPYDWTEDPPQFESIGKPDSLYVFELCRQALAWLEAEPPA
jgi:hypothetical protein